MAHLQRILVVLLLASTVLFTAGAIAERAQGDGTVESAGAESAGMHDEPAAESEAVLGVDTESTPLIGLAVIAGLGLAAVAATRLGRRAAILIAIALVATAWAALDVREAAHQLDESRSGLALVATAVAVLHLAAAAIAARLTARGHEKGRALQGLGQ